VTTVPRTTCGRPSSTAARSTSPSAIARRTDDELTTSPSSANAGHFDDRNLGQELAKPIDVAAARLAEPEVVADDDRLCAEPAPEDPIGEPFGRVLRERTGESLDDDVLDAELDQQPDLVRPRRNPRHVVLRRQDDARRRLERVHERRHLRAAGPFEEDLEHRAMSAMDAVEVPDRHDGARHRGPVRCAPGEDEWCRHAVPEARARRE
jgi:hypothetical protein